MPSVSGAAADVETSSVKEGGGGRGEGRRPGYSAFHHIVVHIVVSASTTVLSIEW